MSYKYEIGQIVQVDMSPKLGLSTKRLSKKPDIVRIINRRTTSYEPEYELEPYPLPDDHPPNWGQPDGPGRTLYEKFLKPLQEENCND